MNNSITRHETSAPVAVQDSLRSSPGSPASSTSTASVSFGARIWVRDDIPAVAQAFAARDTIVAESVIRHEGLVRRFDGVPHEILTAWCADRSGVLVLRFRRLLREEGSRFRATGAWHAFETTNFRSATTPRRTSGVVEAGINAAPSAPTTDGEGVVPLQRSGKMSAGFLPPAVRTTMSRLVRIPSLWLGEVAQFTDGESATPTRQVLTVLRLSQANAAVVTATREHQARGSDLEASAALAKKPWSVLQVAYEFASALERR